LQFYCFSDKNKKCGGIKRMKLCIAFTMLITLSFMTSLVVEQYEIKYGELDKKIKPFFIFTLGLLYGYILRLIYLK